MSTDQRFEATAGARRVQPGIGSRCDDQHKSALLAGASGSVEQAVRSLAVAVRCWAAGRLATQVAAADAEAVKAAEDGQGDLAGIEEGLGDALDVVDGDALEVLDQLVEAE